MIRWGLASTARINDGLLDGARRSKLGEVVAVASRDPARADAYARERGLRAYGSYDELLADPSIDAIYVALPNALHAEWSIRALEAGKHVLCEKPLGRDPAAVERAFATADRAGLVLMEGFMYRHHPQIRKLEELVGEGAIGELRLVRSQFSFTLDRPDDVRWSRELGGGALLDVGCYCVHATRLLAGEPQVVHAEQTLAASGVDVRFAATMRFAGGVLAHFDCGFDLPRRAALEAVGSDGSVLVPDPFVVESSGLELHRGGAVERVDVPEASKFQLEFDNLCRAIRGEEDPLLGARDAIAQARVLEALLRSAETGEAGIFEVPRTPRPGET